MRAGKSVTVQLDPPEYELLTREAERQGTSPRSLAAQYVRAGLQGNGEPTREARRRAGLEALARLADLTADLPPVDAVKIARESRRQLERRSFR